MLQTNLIRSDERPAFNALSSGTTVLTNTQEASPTELLVPTPTLVFSFKSTGVLAYAGSVVAPPARHKSLDTASSVTASEIGSGADGAASASGDIKAEYSDRPESAPKTEAAIEGPIWAGAIEQPPASTQTDVSEIHLSIDSLPHLELIEAFPVTVTQLGDKLFTATIEALRLSGTSSTLGEALVTVKEEIVTLYDRLSKTSRLDDDEINNLKYLQSHIITGDKSSVSHENHGSRF